MKTNKRTKLFPLYTKNYVSAVVTIRALLVYVFSLGQRAYAIRRLPVRFRFLHFVRCFRSITIPVHQSGTTATVPGIESVGTYNASFVWVPSAHSLQSVVAVVHLTGRELKLAIIVPEPEPICFERAAYVNEYSGT